MADEVKGDETVTEPVPVVIDNGAAAHLHKDVMAAITERTPSVRAAVINHLVEEKLEERKRAALSGLTKLKEARANLAKIKPAPSGYDENGKPVAGLYTKEQTEERKKANELIKKFEEALELALGEKADYTKLTQLVGGK